MPRNLDPGRHRRDVWGAISAMDAVTGEAPAGTVVHGWGAASTGYELAPTAKLAPIESRVDQHAELDGSNVWQTTRVEQQCFDRPRTSRDQPPQPYRYGTQPERQAKGPTEPRLTAFQRWMQSRGRVQHFWVCVRNFPEREIQGRHRLYSRHGHQRMAQHLKGAPTPAAG